MAASFLNDLYLINIMISLSLETQITEVPVWSGNIHVSRSTATLTERFKGYPLDTEPSFHPLPPVSSFLQGNAYSLSMFVG
jgi:hypothetical protein